MKTTNKILVLAFMAVAMVFASCSKDNNDSVGPTQQEIEAKIIGKWKTVAMNGQQVLTNFRAVATYFKDRTQTVSISNYNDPANVYLWYNKASFAWSVDGNIVCNKPTGVGMTQFNKVVMIDDNQYSYIIMKAIDQKANDEIQNLTIVEQKVTADYSQDIIGLWEGVEMTGYETYGDAHHRIEYRADGTYTYYNWNEETQKWQPLEDVFDEWNVDGDWLATRWQNKGSDVMNYEWWDIDYIKKEGDDIIMKWSALREKEDGERFTTAFTWKKVK